VIIARQSLRTYGINEEELDKYKIRHATVFYGTNGRSFLI